MAERQIAKAVRTIAVYRAADAAALKAFARACPPGSLVEWSHGIYIRRGEVVRCGGLQSFHTLRVLVEPRSGKRQWVHASRIANEWPAAAPGRATPTENEG